MFMGLIIAVVAVFLFFFKNTAWVVRSYKSYYKDKRKKFPWFMNWEKETNIDVAKIRANECISGQILMSAILYFLIAIAGGWVLNAIIRFVFVNSYMSGMLPGEIGYIVLSNIGGVIALIVAFFVANKVWEDKYQSPGSEHDAESGMALECPSCHCPHSWVMTKRQDIVEEERVERKIITTTKGSSAGSFGGGLIGEGFAAATRSSSTDVIETYFYDGKTHKDLLCLNCGNKKSVSFKKTWKDKKPDEEPLFYDPPKPAWNIGDGGGLRFIRIGILLLLVFLTSHTISNIIDTNAIDAQTSKENNAEVEAILEKLDPSVTHIGSAYVRHNESLRETPSFDSRKTTQLRKGSIVILLNEFVMDDYGENPSYIKVFNGEKTGWFLGKDLKIPKETIQTIRKQVTDSGVSKPVVTNAKTTMKMVVLNAPGSFSGSWQIGKGKTVILTGRVETAIPEAYPDAPPREYSEIKFGENIGWVRTDYLKK